MQTRTSLLIVTLGIVTAWLVPSASATITNFTASATATLTEYHLGVAGQQATEAADYTDPNDPLPLQTVARLVSPEEDAAGMVAAQFSDPRTALGADPDEFAINIALSSISDEYAYAATGAAEEVRTVVFSAAELGRPTGQTVGLLGRLYLDGALAVFAGTDASDLTGTSVTLHVTVVKQVEGHADQTVYTSQLALTGGPDNAVAISSAGNFPVSGVFTTELASVDPELSVFRVVVFPELAIDYAYDAVVGQTFTLRAKVGVEAVNIPGQVGASALIGTPLNALDDVLPLTLGEVRATKIIDAMKQERQQPTGEPAFTAEDDLTTLLSALFPACGLLGFETVLGVIALAGWRLAGPMRRTLTTKH